MKLKYLCVSSEWFEYQIKDFISPQTLVIFDTNKNTLTTMFRSNVKVYHLTLAEQFLIKNQVYVSKNFIRIYDEFLETMQTYFMNEI